MEKIVLVTAYIDKTLYTACVTENPFVRDNPSCATVGFDNSVENLAIPIRYNQFLDKWDYGEAAWFVFCHSDWEIYEDLVPLLRHLDRNTLYGLIGTIFHSNRDGSFTREYRGQCFEKKRDGSNKQLLYCSVHHTGALVDTFDYQCLIVHSSLIARHRLRFDENLHFNLYVEDFCIDALEKHNIKCRILNIRCCHWNQQDNLDERPGYYSDLAYIDKKYPGICRTGTISFLGGASQVIESLCRNIFAQRIRIEHDNDAPEEGVYCYSDVTPDNPNDPRSIVLHYVSPGSTVLDVGCANGHLGIALKHFKQCEVHGFEYNSTSVRIARETGAYTQIHSADLNKIKDNAYPEYFGKFDVIVFGDVLEHLYDPEEVLRKLFAYLKPEGFLLLSLPNVAHASIIANLLRGDFSYTEAGLLDKTHIRFFTRRSIPVFLARNRLIIREYRYTVIPIQGHQSENPYLHLPTVVTTALFNEPHSFVCQYVIKAQLDEIKGFDDCLAENAVLHTLDENANPHLKPCRDQAFAQYPPASPAQADGDTTPALRDAARYAEFITTKNVLGYFKKSLDFVPLAWGKADFSRIDAKLIAFYLPQFYAMSLNDKWWGKGFTEWTNVTRTIPQYIGHYQPRQPIDMGFYNLNDINVMKRQVELARLCGIHAFCFHYYWFSGVREMEKPIFNWLEHPEIDFPFCLSWVNESWTSTWDGGNNEVGYKQELREGDDEKFFADILPFFHDPRYVRINGKPLFIIYRPHFFPKERCLRFTRIMRELADKHGFPGLFMLAVNSYEFEEDPTPYGLDGLLEFPPQCMGKHTTQGLLPTGFVNPFFDGTIVNGADYVKQKRFLFDVDFKLFKGVCPGWDNSPRAAYSKALVVEGITPALYKEWLCHCIEYTRKHHAEQERFVFINAWNEWGEGAYLEPDSRYGYAYLQATREALLGEGF